MFIKILAALPLLFIYFGPVFAGGSSGSSNDSCTSHENEWESEILRNKDNKSYGCNCNEKADVEDVSGQKRFHDLATGHGLSAETPGGYPKIAECQSDNGGWWKPMDAPCYASQPLNQPSIATAQRSPSAICWDLYCTDGGKYFKGSLNADGTRNEGSIAWDKCIACPTATKLTSTYSADSIEFKLESDG